MVTKDKLENVNKNLKLKNKDLIENNIFLLKQQKELKKYAETKGTEYAKIKQELIKLKDKYVD